MTATVSPAPRARLTSRTPTHRAGLVDDLTRLAQRWARGVAYDEERLVAVRNALLDDTATHAAAHLPIYRRLVRELGATPHDRPLLTCDVFKAYDPRWIDTGDWSSMNGWLAQLHSRPVTSGLQATDLDDWLGALDAGGIRTLCSSGSSGMLSFVPRSAEEWGAVRLAGTGALTPLIVGRLGSRREKLAVGTVSALLGPRQLSALAERVPKRRDAAFVLDFADGRTGNQSIGRELAAAFRVRHHLYPGNLSAVALRALGRGPGTPVETAALASLQEALVDNAGGHLARLTEGLRTAAAAGQRAIVFGTPYQLLRLVTAVERSGRPIPSTPGSVVFFGGGWKAFSGEAIARPDLLARITAALGVSQSQTLEGYSMTELNTVLLRCEEGRFHVPPLLEAFVVDDAFREAPNGHGRFAFRDPLATSRPAFLVTGDAVTMVDDACACGLRGSALTTIERAGRQEVKGCAGIAASLPV
jgi:hypothetical protein